MNHFTTAWNPLFSVMKFCTLRHEFAPSVMSPIVWSVMKYNSRHEKNFRHESLTTSWTHFFSVMKCCSLRHEFVHFVISLSYPATTSWSHGLMGAPKLHIFTHQALHQSPQAQHEGVQGFSWFIQSFLQMEFLLVLRIVTPVSVARTGSGICRQIVQFRTFCGCLTSRAGRVAGGRISITNYLEDRDWILFKSNAQLVRSCCRLPSCPPSRPDGGNNPLRPVRQPELVQFYYESTQFHHAST